MVTPFFAVMAFNQLGPRFRAHPRAGWTELIRPAVAADGRSRSSRQAEIHDASGKLASWISQNLYVSTGEP
ncbi:hypothetical protein ACFQ68_03035 [Amycolatopsis japonica]|uniref:hypothetical protein n=1 Tax=Amycolatopsis japonica TaxID=208439 RepID=UPI00366D377F